MLTTVLRDCYFAIEGRRIRPAVIRDLVRPHVDCTTPFGDYLSGQGGARLQALRTTSSGGYGVYVALNDLRLLAPLTVVLHISLIYTRHSSYLLYSERVVLIMYLHLE